MTRNFSMETNIAWAGSWSGTIFYQITTDWIYLQMCSLARVTCGDPVTTNVFLVVDGGSHQSIGWSELNNGPHTNREDSVSGNNNIWTTLSAGNISMVTHAWGSRVKTSAVEQRRKRITGRGPSLRLMQLQTMARIVGQKIQPHHSFTLWGAGSLYRGIRDTYLSQRI